MKKIKLALAIVLIILSIVLGQKILPWWIGGLVSFFCGLLLINKKYTSFVAPFLTASIVWITIAFLKDYNAEVSIAHLVSNIFKDMGEIVIYFMTGFTIAIICGFFGLSGNYFKRMITQNNVKSRR